MPSLSKDVTAPNNRSPVTVTIPVERQILKSACVLDLDVSNPPNDAFVSIGLMAGGTNHQNKISLLASGYVGATGLIGWTGSIPLEPSTYVYAQIYSNDGGVFRLSIIPWKIVATKDGLFVVDP